MFNVALPHSKGKLNLHESMKKILILNGPNLNLLGKREPTIYGSQSFEDYFETLKNTFPDIELHYFQSNHEGALIDQIHEIGFKFDGIIINAGGLTHTSVALADALSSVTTPAIEVHISNIHAREPFRHHSYLTSRCKGMICGLGLRGYELAVEWFVND
jgi:3-dehydroquinate dehydratase-2